MTNSTNFNMGQMSPRFPLPKHGHNGIGSTDAARFLKPAQQADYVKEYEDVELVDNLESSYNVRLQYSQAEHAHMNWAGGPPSHFDRSKDIGRQGSVYKSM